MNGYYSLYEIIAHCEGYADVVETTMVLHVEERSGVLSPTKEAYRTALDGLVASGRVSTAQYQGTTYYAVVPT